MKNCVFVLFFMFIGISQVSADTYHLYPEAGIRDRTPSYYALTHATIHVDPDTVLEDAILIIRNGIIEAVGKNIKLPSGIVTQDVHGAHIYPAFIEMDARDVLEKDATKAYTPGAWTPHLRSDFHITEYLKLSKKAVKRYRSMGFGVLHVPPNEGVIQGWSAVVRAYDPDMKEKVVVPDTALTISLHPRFQWGQGPAPYPTSLMGAIAFVRQTILDAKWYREAWSIYKVYPSQPMPPVDHALEDMIPLLNGRPLFMKTRSFWDILRAGRIAREFKLQAIIRDSGYAYQRIELVKKLGYPLVLPVKFPKTPDVADPDIERRTSLRELMHWYFAPENAKFVNDHHIPFALTAYGLKSSKAFLKNLRTMAKRGVPKTALLRALTVEPARFLGLSRTLGTLEKGKKASFTLVSHDIFDKKATVYEVWIDGKRFPVKELPDVKLQGTWKLHFKLDKEYILTLKIKGEPDKPDISFEPCPKKKHEMMDGKSKSEAEKGKDEKSTNRNGMKMKMKGACKAKNVQYKYGRLVFVLKNVKDLSGLTRFGGAVFADKMMGDGADAKGQMFSWWAEREGSIAEKEEKKMKEKKEEPLPVIHINYPLGAYGRETPEPPRPEYILVKHATIWTLDQKGKIKDADMLVHNGVIVKIGKNISAREGALVIDATGKHITPGLIDAHSHTALDSVNEVGSAITAEVRTQDVINPDSIALYRELAGGLTTAHLLHGSANPIGGQCQVIRLLWGQDDQAMIYREALPTIKFALGENPKQSNWGDRFTSRYPQTRMGVMQIIRDRFQAALDYKRKWEAYKKDPDKKKKIPPRRNLQLEALVEVLEGKRMIHAHSYRQDEILALMKVAEEFGIRIRTFQHVLEGYKVALEMPKHGAGGSTFSDWWAYKFEVYDAIPYNGFLMWKAGVVTSFNSDSSELARRMNFEAAKAVKYGGVPEVEALKFVTLNPAIQLGIDNHAGSLEPGKEATFVIWSKHPFDPGTYVEQTWIRGRKYFDRDEDHAMQKEVKKLRARLIQYILKQKRSFPMGGKK